MHDEQGKAVIKPRPVAQHRFRDKVIRSGFFNRPEHRYISAVLFSNAATISQFQRIAIEQGITDPSLHVSRFGVCYDPNPNALVAAQFSYEPEPGVHRETFAQGMRVLHNPSAAIPLDPDFLMDVSQMTLTAEGLVEVRHPEFAPFASMTVITRTGATEPP